MPSFSQEQRLAIAIGIPTLALLFFLWYKRRQRVDFEDDDEDDDEQEPTVATVIETKIEVKIPQYLVGTVIGRGGANIKQIQKESGAYLRFKDDENEEEMVDDFGEEKPVPDSEKTRTVIIKGERDKAHKAQFLIKKIINEQPKIFTEEYFIPQRSCGRIIGRGGMTIRHLCKVSGAKITISKDDTQVGETRQCTITGNADQIVNAKCLLEEKVAEHEQALARRPANHVTRYQGKEFVKPVYPSIQGSFPSSVQFPNTDDYVEVFVSAIDTPGHFYVQLVRTGDAQRLDKLIDTLTNEVSTAEDIIEPLEVGTVCSAPFAHDDSRYRAKVTQINTDGTVGLYYVDYGDTGTVPKYRLRNIRKEHLQLPFQAIECYLANTKPLDGNWSEQATNDFQDLTHYPNWVGLMAKCIKYCGDRPCLDLYDTSTAQDIYINEEMVEHGFAVKDGSFPPQLLPTEVNNKIEPEKSDVAEAKQSTESIMNKDEEKSAISESKPLTEAELFTVSSPPSFDEKDAGKDLDIRGPATPKDFSPIKSALVKRVSKDYIDTSSVSRNTQRESVGDDIAEDENAKPEVVQEAIFTPDTNSQVESIPEAEFLAGLETTPEVDLPVKSSEDPSTSGSPKLTASQVLKPEVRQMIQMEVSQAFETQVPPEVESTESLIDEGNEVGRHSSSKDIPGPQEGNSTRSDSGIELSHHDEVKHVESTLSVLVDSHHRPPVTETMITSARDTDDDDDDDDDNLETFTSSFTKKVETKKTFVSTVTVQSNHSKISTVTLVPTPENKDDVTKSVTRTVTTQSTKRTYAQAARNSREFDSKGTANSLWTGSDGDHQTGSQDAGNLGNSVVVQRLEVQSKPDENTVFELQREAKSMTSSTEDGTLTKVYSIEQQSSQATTHVTQSTNQKELPNSQLESERKVESNLDRKSPVNMDSDSESYLSALDELASDTDTTSFYGSAVDHISSSTTSLDYVTAGDNTDTDTLQPHPEDLGTPVNSDDDDEFLSDDEDESESGDKTPKRKESLEDDVATPVASAGSIRLAAKCLSDLDLGYRGDSEDVTDSKEDLRG